ncbi:MAG: PIN domain-containing protein [Burkholderiales bacterium]
MRGMRRPRGVAPAIAELPAAPVFFDTNIIVYAHDTTDALRGERARQLLFEAMRQRKLVISTQVMQEFYSVVVRKNWMQPDDAFTALRLLAEHTVVPASADSVLRAIGLQQRYVVSVWDALIVQAALDAGCPVLFSEDLQHGQVFQALGGAAAEVTVVNPFAVPPVEAVGRALHEPSPVYATKSKASRAGRVAR